MPAVLEAGGVVTLRNNTADGGGGAIFFACQAPPVSIAALVSAGEAAAAAAGWVLEANVAGYGPAVASLPATLVPPTATPNCVRALAKPGF